MALITMAFEVLLLLPWLFKVVLADAAILAAAVLAAAVLAQTVQLLFTSRYGHFSGINRKVQLKYQPKGRPRHSSSDDGKGSLIFD